MGNINADFINLLIEKPELSHLPSKQIKNKVIFSWIEGPLKTKLPPSTLRTMDKMILHNRISPSTAISAKHPILMLLLLHSWRNYVTHIRSMQVLSISAAIRAKQHEVPWGKMTQYGHKGLHSVRSRSTAVTINTNILKTEYSRIMWSLKHSLENTSHLLCS